MALNPAQLSFVERLQKAVYDGRADKSLRWNQCDVIENALKFLKAEPGTLLGEFGKDVPLYQQDVKTSKHKAALIESSPGSGKTRIMGLMAKKAADINGTLKHKGPATKVLLLTPRLDLNRQTVHELDKELGIKDKDVAIFDGNQTLAEKALARDRPVLIATYHSLPSMIKQGILSLDPDSPQYRGLVLMDEVHELLDPKDEYGNSTIRSFINDHQMTFLFTGTDDGVSVRHFGGEIPTIYSKRLVQAYNEGLTCEHIQPGLVDIGVKTSEWQDHVQDGTDPSEQHNELLNYFSGHPKVVQAAVNTQLTAKEPYMGALHQYKSIFFVDGVEAGRKGAEYYNSRAAELGLIHLKAAHIHAKTPKKERKQILKDYKEGRTTALFNDSILTFGFDDRETAVVHDLKMHSRDNPRELARMEQIFTRGTRGCDWFEEKYGIKKQSLLLTYRPVNERGEALNVLTAADLLAGLRLRPKTEIRSGGRGKGKSDPDDEEPDPIELSDNLEVTVRFNFGEQMTALEMMRQAHEAAKKAAQEVKSPGSDEHGLKDKDEHWLSAGNTQNPTIVRGGHRNSILKAVRYLTGKSSPYDSKKLGIQEVLYNGELIDLQKMQAGSQQPICIRQAHWNKIEKAAGVESQKELPIADENWISNIQKEPGGQRPPIAKAVKDIIGKYDHEKLGMQKVKYNGQFFRIEKRKLQKGGGVPPVCIYRPDWPKVETIAGLESGEELSNLPKKDKNWLSKKDTRNPQIVPGGQRIIIRKAVEYLTGESSPYDSEKLRRQTVRYNGQFIDLQKMSANGVPVICIWHKHWDKVAKAAGVVSAAAILEDKNENWLSINDTRNSDIVDGGFRTLVINAVEYLTGESSPYDSEKLGVQTINYNGQLIELQKMKSGVHQPICICRAHWGRVEKAAGVEPLHADENLKAKTIIKKEITPNSKDLKRTGRSRSAGEE